MRSLSTLVAAAALALLAVPAWSAGDQDFELVNRTGYTIEQVYVSPIKAKDWQEDVLGRGVDDDSAELPEGTRLQQRGNRPLNPRGRWSNGR